MKATVTGAPHPTQLMRFNNVNWTAALAIGALHVGCLAAPFYFSWSALLLVVTLGPICGCLGITLGFHRLLTHRSFQTFKPVEYLLTLIGCLNWQGSPATWVGTHRLHHAESDLDGDPHSPRHGFTWAHMWWTCFKEAVDSKTAAKDLLRDPVMRLIDRFWWFPQIVLAAALYAIGGMPWLVWGVCVRTVVGYHGTWFVNSAAHTWGYRNFKTTDGSRNNWWVAILSFGEGWHNNHHAYQRSAAHGMRWYELDLTYTIIRVMKTAGLAWKVVVPEEALQQVRRRRAQSAESQSLAPSLPSLTQSMADVAGD